MEIIKLLLVEDDDAFRSVIKECMEMDGEYEIVEAPNGMEGYQAFKKYSFDIIVTDLDMPILSGIEMATYIRKEDTNIPIVVASGLTNPTTIHEAFSVGVDNYIKKPYTSDELDCHVKALLKRLNNNNRDMKEETTVFTIGDFLLDVENRSLKNGSTITSLSKREAQLLYMLYKSKGKLVLRKDILMKFWGSEDDLFHARSLDVFITKLRKYLHADKSVSIVTIRGDGLKLDC